MLAAIIILSLAIIALAVFAFLQFKERNAQIANLVSEVNGLYIEIDELKDNPAKVTVKNLPITYDAEAKTVNVAGNLVAEGHIIAGGKSNA